MIICRTAGELQRALERTAGDSLGFVPTMGALHRGHLALAAASVGECRRTAASIFVNPSQFGPGEDYRSYPRDLDRDAAQLERAHVDLLFAPLPEEIYPADFDTWVQVETLSRPLCGAARPGHFRGVCTVVLLLFNLVRPTRAYFGQKDAQQALIVRRLIRDLRLGIELRVLPTVRDADGLALSSRNAYLSPAERRTALRLPEALESARRAIAAGMEDAAAVRGLIRGVLASAPGLEIEYVETVSLGGLEPLQEIRPQDTLVACAVRVGRTRLIDNFVLGAI